MRPPVLELPRRGQSPQQQARTRRGERSRSNAGSTSRSPRSPRPASVRSPPSRGRRSAPRRARDGGSGSRRAPRRAASRQPWWSPTPTSRLLRRPRSVPDELADLVLGREQLLADPPPYECLEPRIVEPLHDLLEVALDQRPDRLDAGDAA